jgi:hypothetical protein
MLTKNEVVTETVGKCSRCPLPGALYPILVICMKNAAKRVLPERALVPLPLCLACAKELKIADVLTDEQWQGICAVYIKSKRRPPKKNLTRLEFTLVNGPEAKEARRTQEFLKAQEFASKLPAATESRLSNT